MQGFYDIAIEGPHVVVPAQWGRCQRESATASANASERAREAEKRSVIVGSCAAWTARHGQTVNFIM